ncbi:SDR family NAD(P)-dependent oxidoreductase [Lacibacterium aquatile]|uniref:SDR family NAD(P)-dependent oxidoreductase n=1 Tax=Lacibacterium aquatile TaxID=1168082 RepID=A0ABW5DQI8_9PROT
MTEARLGGRLALVTGASKGIGAAVAKALAAEGAHMILVARSQKGLEQVDDAIRAAGGTATLLPMDLREGDKIDQMAYAIAERWGKLDILVANAGMLGALTPVSHIQPKTFDQMIATNLTATWRLIRAVDPLLRVAEAGRVVVTTPAEANGAHPYWGPYAASKAGVEALIRSWAAETMQTRLKINLLDPGPVATALRSLAFPGEDTSKIATPDQVAPRFVELCLPDVKQHGQLLTI